MPSEVAEFFNNLFKNASEEKKGQPHDFAAEREENEKRQKPEIPEGVTLTELKLKGHYGELIEKEGNRGPLVLYIHGGGFTTGAAQERRELTFEIAANRGCNVIANNYRLSPENKWPCHLEDCVEAYEAVLEMGYDADRIVLMGESAGGTLVLSLGLYLRDHNMPLPGAIAAFSPCCNQDEGFPSHKENAKTDYMLGDAVNRPDQLEAVFGKEVSGEILHSDYASPYYADFAGMPPVFLAASDIEALYDDSVYLYKKLKEEGHAVEMDVQKDVCHAYPMFTQMPEAQNTLDKVFAFVRKYVRAGQPENL